jgi:hypothetical protein
MRRRHLPVLAVLAALVVPATAGAAATEWPLEGYWPLMEGSGQRIYDISGRGADGVLGSTLGADKRDAAWITGLMGVGSALRLDGNDYIAVQETARLKPQRMTVEAWVRAPQSPGQWKYVAVKGGDRCRAGSFGLYTSINGGMAFYVYNGDYFYRSPQVSRAIWDNQWHHVAGTYDGSRVHLYVDGKEIGQGTPYSGPVAYGLPHSEFYIGAYRGACDLTFIGDVDEVRVWSAALAVDSIWARITALLHLEPAAPLPEDAAEWYTSG